jgi:hypothetical protein
MNLVVIDNPIPKVPGETPKQRKERRKRVRDEARPKANRNINASPIREPTGVIIYSGEERVCDALDVPLQFKYEGSARAISSDVASIACTTLGAVGLLKMLNDIHQTGYTIDQPALSERLRFYVHNKYDFGTAYAHLRPRWFY